MTMIWGDISRSSGTEDTGEAHVLEVVGRGPGGAAGLVMMRMY